MPNRRPGPCCRPGPQRPGHPPPNTRGGARGGAAGRRPRPTGRSPGDDSEAGPQQAAAGGEPYPGSARDP
eukprot:14950751-Alexandrium_andersonii.AAC.1